MTIDCVIVGFDDSATSRAALRWAAGYAIATATDLCAVHVLDWPTGLTPASVKQGIRLYVPKRDIAEPYRRGIQQTFESAEPPHGSTLQFAQGDVGDVLVRLSDHANLLVVGAREPVRGRPHLHGSVSHYCISHASCPVVTVPEHLLTDQQPTRPGRHHDTPIVVAG
jgi:nucleotide-binding universal stress UspA family protein